MEAKVDIRKLQVLNDRINQTIDALNQVRLTVHGLGHTTPFQQMTPFQGVGAQQPYGQVPFGQVPFGQQPFGQQPFGQQPFGQVPGMQGGFGLQHTSPVSPYNLLQLQLQNPWLSQLYGANPMMPGMTPFTGSYGQGGLGGTPQGPGAGGWGGGLLHSSPDLIEQRLLEIRAADPSRITSTFPYLLAPQSPLVNIW